MRIESPSAINAQLPLRILALSDLHSDESLLGRIPACIDRVKPDAVLVLGDITTRGPLSYAEDALAALSQPGIPLYALFGNMDTPDVRELLGTKGIGIHLRRVGLEGGWGLVGFGGSRTSIGTPSEFPEDKIYSGLAGMGIGAKTILATHSPPYGADGLDSPRQGVHAGSTAIRRIIEERQPALNLCGHIHETEGEATIGRTLIAKVGAAQDGRAALVETGRKIKVGFIDI